MTNTIWTNSVSGDWSDAGDWSAGVPTASEDAVINADGDYVIAITSADGAKSLTMDAAGATLSEAAAGSFFLTDSLTLDTGTIILNGENEVSGQTRLVGGTLKLGDALALRSSNLSIEGGSLVGIADFTFSNSVDASGTFTLAAGHGDTFTFAGQTVLDMNDGGAIQFGDHSGDNGTLIWDPLTLGIAHGGAAYSVYLNAGTLRDGDGSLGEVLSPAASVNIAAGATLDIYGHSETIHQLKGSGGVITSSVAGGALTIGTGSISGITGSLSLTISHSLILTGAADYTGATIIDSGAALYLQAGGSIQGNILDDGILNINGGATVPTGVISGPGSVTFDGGTVVLNKANTYSGGTTLSNGILYLGNAAALGTGKFTISSGQLTGTATEALSNQLAINGAATIFADNGKTLTLNTAAAWKIASGATISFGYTDNTGVVVWDSPSGSGSSRNGKIEIVGGTLRAGDSNFQTLLDAPRSGQSIGGFTRINQTGTLDVAGVASTIYNLLGTGTIENSGPSATVTIDGGKFSGHFSGQIVLDIGPHGARLGGEAANWSTINLDGDLYLHGASSSNIVFSPGQSVNLKLANPLDFTGSIAGFDSTDPISTTAIILPEPRKDHTTTISYSGDAAGGTLSVSTVDGTANIHMIGNFTNGHFFAYGNNEIRFAANPSPVQAATASVHADTFDFSAVPATPVVPEAGVVHLHGGHGENDGASAHDLTEAMQGHDSVFDHIAHDLVAHGHAGMVEALL